MIKKTHLLLFSFFCFSSMTNAQVGIGTTLPKGALDIESLNTGMLIPRVKLTNTATQAPVINPQGGTLTSGTLIYNTETINDVLPGFYYWSSTEWIPLKSAAVATATSDHNTLDKAYDQGGAGVGRAITADNGAVQITTGGTTASALYLASSVANGNTLDVVQNNVGTSIRAQNNMTGNNQYSTIQGVTYSSNALTAGVLGINKGLGYGVIGQIASTDTGIGGVYGANLRTNGGYGVYGVGGLGVRGLSSTTSGQGVAGFYNGTGAGTGGFFNGIDNNAINAIFALNRTNTRTGVIANGNYLGVYSAFTANEGFGYQTRGSYYTNLYWMYGGVLNGVAYDIYRTSQPKKMLINSLGPGSINSTVQDGDKTRMLPAVVSPENSINDYGTATLTNGRARVNLDPILSKIIKVDQSHPLKIFIQLEGESNGVYVTNKSASGFDVVELNNGNSNIPFSYSLIATRNDEVKDKNTIFSYDGRFIELPVTKEIEVKLAE